MNALGDLIRKRVAELQQQGISLRAQAARGGWDTPGTLRWWMRQTTPVKQLSRGEVVDQIALALDLPRQQVWAAAVMATLPDHPTPLQRLLREAQARLGLDSDALARAADITPVHLYRILAGESVTLKPDTVRGLARAFKLTQGQIREAAVLTVDYRLPASLASRMTPEKWAEVLRVIEVMVDGG